MTLETRARRAVAELAQEVERDGIPRLRALTEAAGRRRRRRSATVSAVLAFVVGVVAVGAVQLAASPGSSPSPSPTALTGLACRTTGITCAGGRISLSPGVLEVPLSFTPVPGLDTDDITPTVTALMLRGERDGRPFGMWVLEDPVAADPVTQQALVPGPAGSARELATWITALPFVAPATARPATVGGYAGWRVDVSVRPGARLPSISGLSTDRGQPAAFVLGDGTISGGESNTTVSQALSPSSYYVVDVPRHRPVVVWLWMQDATPGDLDSLRPLVDSLRLR